VPDAEYAAMNAMQRATLYTQFDLGGGNPGPQ
jgi:hypothetical protein